MHSIEGLTPMLEALAITKYYGVLPAVRDVSFAVTPGEIVGYLGRNGSGKSTTIRMLVGLMTPSAGDVRWRGQSIFDDLPRYRRHLGYVPEEPHLYTHLTAHEYLQLVGGLRDLDQPAIDAKAERFLELLGLADHRYAMLASFSKGMRQKVLLAGALLHDPALIILDEPFSGLDIAAALMLRTVLRDLAAAGRTILMSSHQVATVEHLCNRVIMLSEGRVVANDRIDQLRERHDDASLEAVFVTLAVPDDVRSVAAEFVTTVTAC